MRTRFLLLTALAAWVAGAAHAWPTLPPRCDAARPAPTLDQLIDQLAEVRATEAALQTRRADLERQVRERLDEQARRLQQVGVAPAGAVGPSASSPVVPALHTADLPPLLPGGYGPGVAPPPTAVPATPDLSDPAFAGPRTFTPGSVEYGPFEERERGLACGWPRTGALADRFDALGGLPVAYNRWWRDTAPRRGQEPLFYIGASLFGGN